MARFNLTFRGEILAGHDKAQAQRCLVELFGLDDPAQLQQCFTGDTVVLRRNLERKEAAELFVQMRANGMEARLVKIAEHGIARSDTSPGTGGPPRSGPPRRGRRVDKAASQGLAAEEAAQLKTRERALRKALRTKKKTEARLARAAEREQEKALEREAARNAELEAASKKAELAEQQRLAAAEAQRRKIEEQRRQEEERARIQAEKERARTAERAREEARRATRQAERERQLAQERQRKQELERLAAEKAARLEAQRREQAQRAAQAKVETARRKRLQAEEAARRKAEEVRRRAEEKAREEAALQEQVAQRKAMEQQAERRAALELGHLNPTAATGRVKTRMELPTRKRATADGLPQRRKRQPGEPNLFSLRPFRNTQAVRERAALSRHRLHYTLGAAALFLVSVLVICWQLLSPPPVAVADGASDMAVAPMGRLALLASDHLLLHDRAGVGQSTLTLRQLGLDALQPPLAFDAQGRLLAPGWLAGSAATTDAPPTLLRCSLQEPTCTELSGDLAGTTVSALAVHPLDGSIFIADAAAGELLHLAAEGQLLARASAAVPARPALRLDAGLLLMNSTGGSGVDVFRYEQDAFGKQLDEILVLPDIEAAADYRAVRDFLHSGDTWWAILERAAGQGPGLFRFDEQWNSQGEVELPSGTVPAQLAAWGQRVLVRDPARIPLLKFSQQGVSEAPLVSTGLSELVATQQRHADLALLGWRAALALSVLALIASTLLAGLYRLRYLVYTSSREQGAEPLEPIAEDVTWVAPAGNRQRHIESMAKAWAVLSMAAVLVAVGLGVSAMQLAALLLALAGPAFALLLLHGSEPGHIGGSGTLLVLADHEGEYHLGGGSRVHYRGPFVMIDDVTVFTGTAWLPAFDPEGLKELVAPLVRRGIRVDRRILAVRLLQNRHPLAMGAAVILACACCALALLSLPALA